MEMGSKLKEIIWLEDGLEDKPIYAENLQVMIQRVLLPKLYDRFWGQLNTEETKSAVNDFANEFLNQEYPHLSTANQILTLDINFN